jgi:hypothetical protein
VRALPRPVVLGLVAALVLALIGVGVWRSQAGSTEASGDVVSYAPPSPSVVTGAGPGPSGSAVPTPTVSGKPRAEESAASAERAAGTGPLAFAMPGQQALHNSPRKVFAHYFTPYPLSLDNAPSSSDYYTRNYLEPGGEGGKHRAYGGLLRQRPLPRATRSGDWQLADLETEVRRASAAGLDGFTLDMLNISGPNWDRQKLVMKAAERAAPSFRIIPMPDMAAMTSPDKGALASAVAELARSRSAYRLADGRLVVSPFKAEGQSAAWWKSWIALMRSKHGIRVAFVPTFLDWRANAKSFAPLSYGFSNWGNRSPASNRGVADNAADAHAMGKLWMQPVAPQDVRPRSYVYDESANTESFRMTWNAAIAGKAEWVQMVTWNDYSEGAEISPSTHTGWSLLDLTSYYATRYKTGSWPRIDRDTVYVSHRTQFVDARPAAGQRLMKLRGGSTAPRNTVEVLSFLAAPATVRVTVGGRTTSWKAGAGVSTKLVPLRHGRVSASVARNGRTTASVRSPFEVVARPKVQDLQYHFASSGR